MNKKTLLLAGLALGCSMAVAGVGVAVSASRTLETKAAGTDVTAGFGSGTGRINVNQASKTGNDSAGNTWTVTTSGTTSFTANASYSQIGSSSKPASSITLTTTLDEDYKITSFVSNWGGFNGTAGTVTMKVGDETVASGALSGSSNVAVSQNNGSHSDGYIGNVLTITVTNISKGVKLYDLGYTFESTSTEKSFSITGISSTGLYLKGETYDIGFEAIGFETEPTITDVVWSVPSGAGSIADGKWIAGPAAMASVTLGVDLKADGDDYHAEVTTKIDEVKHLVKNSPKARFNAGEVFTVGGNFTIDYEYAANGSIPATDPEISYRLENVGGTKIKDLVYGETALTVEDSGSYVDVTYRGADLNERYTITVLDVFDNTAGAYYLVTDETELSDGDHVTFFGYYEKDQTKLSFVPTEFRDSNLGGLAVAFDNNAIDGKQDFSILDFKLKDTGSDLEGSFAFASTNAAAKLGQYLYAADSGKNQLKTQDAIDQNARFVIDIDDSTSVASIVASGSSNRNVMSPNGNNSPALFSCYANNSTIHDDNDLYLYKWVSNTDKLNEFATSKLKMNEYVGDNTYSEERCTANYAAAKAAFNELTASQRSLFVAQSGEGKAYHDAYLRLTAWATANGEELGGTDNVLAAKAASMSIFGSGNNDSTMLIALAVVGTGALAAGGFMLAARKRRKEF